MRGLGLDAFITGYMSSGRRTPRIATVLMFALLALLAGATLYNLGNFAWSGEIMRWSRTHRGWIAYHDDPGAFVTSLAMTLLACSYACWALYRFAEARIGYGEVRLERQSDGSPDAP